MVLNGILAALAGLSFVLLLWQWLVARRFPLHRRIADKAFAPPVTVLKPLKGADTTTAVSLRSWFAQDYAGEVQILFGVASESDPVCEIVRGLIREFLQRDAQLVVCSESFGANAKVSKLIQLQRLAKHDIIVVSDADVRAPPDLLVNLVYPFTRPEATLSPTGGEGRGEGATQSSFPHQAARDKRSAGLQPALSAAPAESRLEIGAPKEVASSDSWKSPAEEKQVGLVTCLYRLANPTTAAMRWEAVAVNADFWSQVLQARSMKPLDFALGAVMAVRRQALEKVGGFAALADYLADDYQLGNRIARAGWRIELCPVVVDCWSPPMDWKAVWEHQLRWARTIRVCQPLPYFLSILNNPTLWPLVWVAVCPSALSFGFFSASFFIRALITENLQHWFTQKPVGVIPILSSIKDLLQAAIWFASFAGNKIEWRRERYRLTREGKLERAS